MPDFTKKLELFFSDFGESRKMVLSTSENGKVSSRMMSIIQAEGRFWFQTDKSMKKYHQIMSNSNVALCIDNIQIEGICEEKGHPLENDAFCIIYKKCFRGSFEAYSSLKNERLFVVTPMMIERWIYKDGVPYIETFDLKRQIYGCEQYETTLFYKELSSS